MTLEESRKRTEASLARKRVNVGLANGNAPGPEVPASPATSGAMDSLLEKLRAAAPQARDQRDRRRRARLKERHQVRVASGQQMPDNLLSNEGEEEQDDGTEADIRDEENAEGGLVPPQESESGKDPQISEGEDVADRAASMLQGLRGNADRSGERLRRRRESADEERRNRRLRRRNGTGGSKDSAEGAAGLSSVSEPSPTELGDGTAEDENEAQNEKDEEIQQAPSIIVSPTPTPDQREASDESKNMDPETDAEADAETPRANSTTTERPD